MPKLWLHDVVQCIDSVTSKAAAMGVFDEDASVTIAMYQSIAKFIQQANH